MPSWSNRALGFLSTTILPAYLSSLQNELLNQLDVSWSESPNGLQCIVKSRAHNDISYFNVAQEANKVALCNNIWDAIGH